MVTNYHLQLIFFRGFTSLATIGHTRFWRYMGSTDVIGPVGISTHSGAYSTRIWDFVTHFLISEYI